MKMITSNQSTTIIATNLRATFENELMNAFKTGRGRILKNPVILDAVDGTWKIVRITNAGWDDTGSSTIIAKVEVVAPTERIQGIRPARLNLNLRGQERSAELKLIRLR